MSCSRNAPHLSKCCMAVRCKQHFVTMKAGGHERKFVCFHFKSLLTYPPFAQKKLHTASTA